MADEDSGTTKMNSDVLEVLIGNIEGLRAEVMSLHKPQWQTWGIMAGLFMSMAVGAYTLAIIPIRNDIYDVKSAIKDMVPREEHMTKWAMYDKEVVQIQSEIALLQADVGHKLDRLDVEQLRADLKAKINELNERLESAKRR